MEFRQNSLNIGQFLLFLRERKGYLVALRSVPDLIYGLLYFGGWLCVTLRHEVTVGLHP